MSGHSVSALMLFIGVAAIALVSQHTDTVNDRAPAMSKKELLWGDTSHRLGLRHTQKLRGPLSSNIEMLGAVPEKAGDVFVLKGSVVSSEELRDVNFKWDIPVGLELVNGSSHGTISILKAEIPVEVQLTLRSLTGQNHQVHLLAAAQDKSVRFSDTAQYNTLTQPVVEASKEALAKSTEASVKKSKQLKIFH